MSTLSIVHLGVVVFALFLSTQVASQNITSPPGTNSTSNPNSTMAPGTFSSSANATTTPTGAGILLHADVCSFLVPILMAVSLLQCYC